MASRQVTQAVADSWEFHFQEHREKRTRRNIKTEAESWRNVTNRAGHWRPRETEALRTQMEMKPRKRHFLLETWKYARKQR